jgi:hypothetical protein
VSGGPLHSIGSAELGIVFAIALTGSWAASRLIEAVGPGDPSVRPIRLECPLTASKARELVEGWEKSGNIGAVRRWVYADFFFLLCYGVALVAVGTLAGRAAESATLATVFFWTGLGAPVFDVFEDVGMLKMLRKHFGARPALTSAVSAIKWVLAIGVGVGSLGVLVVAGLVEIF